VADLPTFGGHFVDVPPSSLRATMQYAGILSSGPPAEGRLSTAEWGGLVDFADCAGEYESYVEYEDSYGDWRYRLARSLEHAMIAAGQFKENVGSSHSDPSGMNACADEANYVVDYQEPALRPVEKRTGPSPWAMLGLGFAALGVVYFWRQAA
jgi:hypothetical protein